MVAVRRRAGTAERARAGQHTVAERFIYTSARPVVFLHVQKTAGNSLTNMLYPHFRPSDLYPRHGVLELRDLDAAGWRRYRLFAGHYDYSELALVPADAHIVTMLREPVERVLSLYRFWHSYSPEQAERDALHGPLFAHAAGLEGFFLDAPPDIRANYENAMIRQLVGFDHVDLNYAFTRPDDEIVEIAKRRVDRFAACGITEHFELSAQRLFAALGLGEPTLRFDNPTVPRPEDEALTVAALAETAPALLQRLREMTALDRQIYDYARDRLLGRAMAPAGAGGAEVLS